MLTMVMIWVLEASKCHTVATEASDPVLSTKDTRGDTHTLLVIHVHRRAFLEEKLDHLGPQVKCQWLDTAEAMARRLLLC